jgi:DNA-binding transcriptional LysR family regulator
MSGSMMQQFDVFARVVASGNIAASAQELGLPVATVIEAMNMLEQQLGFRLFTVESGMVELTPAGRKAVSALAELSLERREPRVGRRTSGEEEPPHDIAAEAPSLADAVQEIEEPPPSPQHKEGTEISARIDDRAPAPKHFRPYDAKQPHPAPDPVQNIVLASHPAIFSHFQEALVAFEQSSPDIGITLRLAPLDAAQLSALFADRLADIGYFYTLEEHDALRSRYAWSERISLFSGKKHALARLDSAVAEDLAAIPYVALAPGNIARALAEEALAKSGLDVGQPVLETDDLYQIMKHVEAHESYFAAFGPVARDFGRMSGIARIAYAQGLPQVHVRQAVRPDKTGDAAVMALAEFLFR